MNPVTSLDPGPAWPEPATPATGAPAAPAGDRPGLEASSSLEAFEAGDWWREGPEAGVAPLAPPPSPEVAAQAAREAQGRRDAEGMHAAMGPALRSLARGAPAPVGLTRTHISEGSAGWPRFLDAMRSEDFGGLARRLPRAEAQALLEKEVAQAWRGRPPGELAAITDHLAGKLDQHLRLDGGFRMRDQAVAQLRGTASSLEAVAAAPRRAGELSAALGALARGSTDQQAQAARLRVGLGLAEGAGEVPDQLRERAALLRAQADALAGTGFHNLPRALAAHEVGEATMRAAGIAPGSWAARGLALARQGSETDRWRYEAGEVLAGAVAVGASALLGPAGPAGLALATGLELSTGGLGVGLALHEVDRAVAGETAGTMPAGSADQARFDVAARAATVGVSAVATPVLGGALADGLAAAAPAVAHVLGHRGLHAAGELAVRGAVEASGHASTAWHPHPDGGMGAVPTGE